MERAYNRQQATARVKIKAVTTKCAIPSLFHKLRAPAVGKSNGKSNRKSNGNRKSHSLTMAIVHVVMKSSSTAPPAAAHAQYIARDGQYEQRGGLELVESGNMPDFAQENPQAFWEAADAFERKNGRAYTELQIALPRELNAEQRNELAREATRELLGERFAYTLAVHSPLAKDNIEQPHMHLMFSERVVDSNTQSLSEDRFFKRNGAKKDPDWHNRDKPMEVREKWVEMMNAAMAQHGQEQQLDARSWVNQGREDLAALREEKTLRGDGPEVVARHEKIDRQRQQRAELPMPGMSMDSAAEQIEKVARRQIGAVREREAQELSLLDTLIAAAKELAEDVKKKAIAAGKALTDRAREEARLFVAEGPLATAWKRWQGVEALAHEPPPTKANPSPRAMREAWTEYAGGRGIDAYAAQEVCTSSREEIRITYQSRVDSYHQEIAKLEKSGSRLFRSNVYQDTIDGYKRMVQNEGKQGNMMLELADRFEQWKPVYERQALEASRKRHEENRLLYQELKPHIEPAIRERASSQQPQRSRTQEQEKSRGKDRDSGWER